VSNRLTLVGLFRDFRYVARPHEAMNTSQLFSHIFINSFSSYYMCDDVHVRCNMSLLADMN